MVPEGFKFFRHIGLIPTDWEVHNASYVCLKITDGTHDTPKPTKSGVPYIKSIHVKKGRIEFEKCLFLDRKDHNVIYKRCNPQKSDLLIVNIGAGNIGDYAYVDVEYEFSMKNVALLKPNPQMIDSRYLYQYYQSIKDRVVQSTKTGGAQPFLSLTDLKRLKILTPTLPEQKKIAQILSTWDKAIEKLESLITAKQKRKKALMQQLLTGKKRFSGFDGEWTEYKLDQICQFKKGKGLSKEKLSPDGKYKCVLYGELYTKYKEVISNVVSRTDDNESVKSVFGDILIPSSTTTSGIDLANAVAILEKDVFLGGDINILRPNMKKVCSEFLAYLLTHIKKHQIASRAQGITIIHLYGSALKPLAVNLPDIIEQQKIATVLSSTDQEVETHEKQLSALKEQKKGLMQQLLTGKKRVKIDEPEQMAAVGT